LTCTVHTRQHSPANILDQNLAEVYKLSLTNRLSKKSVQLKTLAKHSAQSAHCPFKFSTAEVTLIHTDLAACVISSRVMHPRLASDHSIAG
jgi:hypothetical protein